MSYAEAKNMRAKLVRRFGLRENASAVDVAKQLIEADNLWAPIPATKEQACAFLALYSLKSKLQGVKPFPKDGPNEIRNL
jgi:hypothetical protein